MRIVFMGSGDFACPSLQALRATWPDALVGVVTQPDRPKGRHLALTPCPAKAVASPWGLPLLTPERVNDPESLAALRAWQPDLIVVVAYGQILRAELLALPPRGLLNVHGSLLPRYRGAAPVQWALAQGETVTGVTTMWMNAGVDSGDILLQQPVPIAEDDTGGTLSSKVAAAGAELLVRTLQALQAGTLRPQPQDEAQATLAPKIRKTDGRIDWTLGARRLCDRMRAFNPWPCCTCVLPWKDAVLRVLQARAERGAGLPGAVLDIGREGPLVMAGEGAVRLLAVQPEGRRAMTGAEFLHGCLLKVGDRLR